MASCTIPVSYTHLDVYKRQALLPARWQSSWVTSGVSFVPAGRDINFKVAATLDVYKRQVHALAVADSRPSSIEDQTDSNHASGFPFWIEAGWLR